MLKGGKNTVILYTKIYGNVRSAVTTNYEYAESLMKQKC